MSDYKLLIGGRLVDGDASMDVINPASEEVLAACPRGSERQMNEAVAAAKEAFKSWRKVPMAERRAMVMKLADAVEARVEEFGRLLTQEQGKPLAESTAEIAYTAAFLRYLASLDLENKLIEDNENRRVEMRRKPLGVVGCIIPWNFPVLIVAFKAPVALLAGNTIVIKPAPTTPLTTLRLGELIADIFPAGVVNIVTDQNDLGGVLTTHPDVAKISFTGSTETGKKVMASAASSIKRITLELGGNDAAIVLGDVDPKTVAPGIFGGATMNAGQVCLAIKRVYAHESIYDELCDELAKLADAAVVDDGLKQGAQIGPLQNKMQYEKVKGFLEDARVNGTIIAGGVVEDRPGYFIRPTIVRDVSDGTMIVDEEQFGPILPVIKFSDVDDALERANASPWGLGGSVWSTDRDKAYDIACEVDSGTVWINKHLDFGPNIPFGGAKQSGIGVEFAEEGLYEFTQIQVINEAR
ncbi:MAG: aldehyde dehydrogenase family protein [Novosphingobium sp.]|uniref:aldehyde dehydrogenase family protein n=1 Tax=Novosphingobium sp. TaxID=1874826 RepID=UPI001D4BD21F|nr:aldehyde dehydrogenase family protein [Novosphingobium sp.]MCB2058524.1 aldehyde dehydrogenase family protein [Novosphingobium sp.]MCP5386413.1 aldehyde dehydrogenase family protein [Novosphingobium sp.]